MNIFGKVTMKNLKENHVRTLVTIIGIILSAAMFTAVTTSVSSLLHFLIEHEIYDSGSWYAAAYNVSLETVEQTKKDDDVQQAVAMERIGYADLEKSGNKDKPYLCVYGIQPDFTDLLPVHLTRGRMPESDTEILLPEHLETNGNISYALDDTLKLRLGQRADSRGTVLDNRTPLLGGDLKYGDSNAGSAGNKETLINLSGHSYRVVGFYERPDFENFDAPGYSALTLSRIPADGIYDMYLRTVSGKAVTAYMNTHFPDGGTQLNYGLLRLYGYSGESSYNAVLKSLACILMGIILFGSISLIYNAFSISISERTKQFGLLASIGATKRQLTGSVLYEAFFLSCVGIPLGILSGLIGLEVTFYFTGDYITDYLFSTGGAELILYPSPGALLAAAVVSLLTILVSAYLPARRSLKKSAIDALRQTGDIAVRSEKVKTSRLTQRLFGFEGMLAAKNFKRNRKKYRATVISLFLSVVLFISASSLSAYLTSSVGQVMDENSYDISYFISPSEPTTPEQIRKEFSSVSGITDSAYLTEFYFDTVFPPDSLSREYKDYQKKDAEWQETEYHESEETIEQVSLYFIEDTAFLTYLEEQGLSREDYFNAQDPAAVALDYLTVYGVDSRYHTMHMLSGQPNSGISLLLQRNQEGYSSQGTSLEEDGSILYYYEKNDNPDEVLKLTREEACLPLSPRIGSIQKETPFCVNENSGTLRLMYPYSMMDSVFSGLEEGVSYTSFAGLFLSENQPVSLYFRCEDHKQAYQDMSDILRKQGMDASNLYDRSQSNDQQRALIFVVNIFSFGFIILISLIAAANVFNTISTNISLRRREFAMLKSIGLAPKGLRRMMNYECLLYGFKGLLYGLPASFGVTWLIYHAISNGLETDFYIPWASAAIAICSVFAVVFATMLYSMRKLKSENTVDALKNENL